MLFSHDGSSISEISEFQKTIKMKKKMKTMKMKKIIEGIVVMEALVSVEAEGFRSVKVAIDKAKKQCRFSLGSASFYASSTLMSRREAYMVCNLFGLLDLEDNNCRCDF
ncbi:uncharacterized protein LOC114279624 isoform X2 [Camellia sinensis]|uniref:uncharacterized protein LOC114279624 isoform X2 n=1 Tax=Camellia sinensis TaxID=4442 RepID=UPI0010359041|nr:uncharacterized protein LOC114279624 isoform X2 [Camellia sinensis]